MLVSLTKFRVVISWYKGLTAYFMVTMAMVWLCMYIVLTDAHADKHKHCCQTSMTRCMYRACNKPVIVRTYCMWAKSNSFTKLITV